MLAACCLCLVAAPNAPGQSLPDAALSGAADGPEAARQSPDNWFEARLLIEEAIEAGDLDGAAALGERLIELTVAEFGDVSTELAEAWRLLAEVDRRIGNHTAAETAILRAIDIYADLNGPLSPVLIDPFLDLGENYDEAGDYTSAISAYGEARTIGRRNFGLLNSDQIAIIDDMTAAAERLGDLEIAQGLQLEALTLIERTSEEFSPEAIDARYKYADWLRSNRMHEEARTHYFDILRAINRYYDDDPMMRIRAYRERAESYREERFDDSAGLSGLRESIELLEAMPDPPLLLLAEVYLEVADWNVQFSSGAGFIASEDYLKAWELLGSIDNGDQLRREWFEELTVVQMGAVSRRGLSDDPDAPKGSIEIHFTVDRAGRAREIEIVSANPSGFKESDFVRQYRGGRFRPRVEDGRLVDYRRARLIEFFYDPSIVDDE
jgi:tetratricopeptide (TPR) repeat protein